MEATLRKQLAVSEGAHNSDEEVADDPEFGSLDHLSSDFIRRRGQPTK